MTEYRLLTWRFWNDRKPVQIYRESTRTYREYKVTEASQKRIQYLIDSNRARVDVNLMRQDIDLSFQKVHP